MYLLAAALLAVTTAQAATISLIAYVTFALEDASGNTLPDGSVVMIIGSFDANNDGMQTYIDGYIADSVQGDDVYIGAVQVGLPSYNETPGTFYTANQFTYDDTLVSYLYLRIFDYQGFPVVGEGINWIASPLFDIAGDSQFGRLTLDFIGGYETTLTNNFYVIPEPGTGHLFLLVLGLAGGMAACMRKPRRKKGGRPGPGFAPLRRGKHLPGWLLLLAGLSASALLGGTQARAQGPLLEPLHVCTVDPIQDEFGTTNLVGSATWDAAQCDLVQVLWVSNSVIYPPDYNGNPNASNSPLSGGISYVGNLTAAAITNPGFFSVSMPDVSSYDRGKKLFVRVFNAPTLTGASFYADSQVLQQKVSGNEVLIASIGATTNAIDPRDFDNDGLNNSWETSYATDKNNWDTDGDGMSDGHEIRAGTLPLDSASLLLVREYQGEGITTIVTNDIGEPSPLIQYTDSTILWPSVPGKRYQVEYSTNYLAADPSYTNVSDVITAVGDTTQTTITNGLADGVGQYRLRLVE